MGLEERPSRLFSLPGFVARAAAYTLSPRPSCPPFFPSLLVHRHIVTIRAKEMQHMQNVLADDNFRANPLLAVQQHIKKSVAVMKSTQEGSGMDE